MKRKIFILFWIIFNTYPCFNNKVLSQQYLQNDRLPSNGHYEGNFVKLYPYYVEPAEYADYSRRPFKTPCWQSFNNTVQFVGGRCWGGTFGVIDGQPPNWLPGAKVMRPNYTHFLMSEDSLHKTLQKLKKGGYYVFNINAYGPGTPPTGIPGKFIFGQFKVEPWKARMMEDILKDRYMGFDLGEQDGRYWADARSVDYPMTPDFKERYINAMKYMQRAAMDQGNILSQLSVKWFWHYPAKDGFITLMGAETQNKTYTSNAQVQYAFLRGASKQYGLLLYGDISIYNSWGWKYYGDENEENAGPSKGNSVSWMKRMLMAQYQYNSAILGFEDSKFYLKHNKETGLSPIGKLQTDMQDFIGKNPRPGPQLTPVALLLDFFSGWMTPSDPFPERYKVWNCLPYRKGDFLTHELFMMFYPDYDQNGINRNEHGALCCTPYGDALDVLLSDTRISTLSRYQVVIVAGELNTGLQEVADKLDMYTKHGGHLILTDENAAKLYPDFELKRATGLFEVLNISNGMGMITVIHSPDMGIEKDNSLNIQVKNYLDSIFKSTRIFSVGDSLGYITNIDGKGKYMIGVYNNSLMSKPFKITSLIGPVEKITELKLIRDLTNEPGYYPEGYENTKQGKSDENNIAAGDTRLFLVDVDEENVEYLDKVTPEKSIRDRYLAMSSLLGIPGVLQSMPTFFDYFSGIKVSWKSVWEIDSMSFNEDSWWYNLKKMQLAVRFDNEFAMAYKKDPGILYQVIFKLSGSKYPDLLIYTSDFPGQIKEKISSGLNGRCRSVTEGSDRVFFCRKGEIDFSEIKNVPVIIDNYYDSWDEIYPVARALSSGQKIILNKNIIDDSISEGATLKVKPGNSDFYFSHHDAKMEISLFLTQHPEYLEHFGGIKVDGTYLFLRSNEKCASEAELIKKIGLKIIVDLTRETNNYPNLTWLAELGHSYTRSVLMRQNILQKMQIMGIENIIIGSHMRPEQWRQDIKRSQEESIISGMSEFIKNANSSGIEVSIQNMMFKHYPSRLLASPDEVCKLVSAFEKEGMNVSFAANLGFGEDPINLISSCENQLKICVVASEGSKLYDYRVPFLKSGRNQKPVIVKNIKIVFDADYGTIQELIEDKCIFTE